MAEEKAEKNEQKKKTPGVAKLVFKWLGLGVVCVLLLGAVVLQAPWKVTTLLVIILAACTVLPKPARKWFWASVGVIVIALIVWVFLPESDGDWRAYTFDEELAVLEAKHAIPDEENAAKIYNELLGDYNLNVCPVDPNADVQLLLPVREPWKSNEHPRLAQWLEDKQDKIAKLLEASEIEKCRFPIEADITQSTQEMVRLGAMRQWAYWLVTMANNDRGEGRADEALRKEMAVLRIAQHQYQQPTLVNLLVGVAIESFGIQQVKRVVATGDAGEDYLKTIEQALSKIGYDWASDFPRVLDREKLLAKNLWGMFYVVNPQGRTRLNPEMARRARVGRLPEDVQQQIRDKIAQTYLRRKLNKASTILCWFYMPSTPQRAGEIIDVAYERCYAVAEPDYDWQKALQKPSGVFRLNYRYLVECSSGPPIEAYYHIRDIYLRVTADKRASRIMVALRHYKNANGRWPGSLDEVRAFAPEEIFIDPVNDGSFVYKLTDDGFALYSKGKNGIDDGGKRERDVATSCAPDVVDEGCDDLMIWPWGSKRKENAGGQQQ